MNKPLARAAVLSAFFLACGGQSTPGASTPAPLAAATPDASAPAPEPATTAAVPAPRTLQAAASPPFLRDADGIRAAMRSRSAGVALCYTQFSARRPNVEGPLALHVVIDPKGAVSTAEAGKPMPEAPSAQPNVAPPKPPIEDAELAACIGKEVLKLQFVADAKGKETRVDYPFLLTAKRVAEGRI